MPRLRGGKDTAMKFLKNQKFQMGALCVLLVVVIAAGAWWFLRPQGDNAGQPAAPGASAGVGAGAEPSEEVSATDVPSAFLSNLKPRAYSIVREDAMEAELSCYGIAGELFWYEGQVCCFRAVDGEDLSIEVASMLTGETLRTYTADDFYGHDTSFTSLYMDCEGALWALYEVDHDPTNIRIIPCKEGVSKDDVLTFDLSAELDEPASPTTFAVWKNYVVIHSGTHSDEDYYYSNQMLAVNTDSGEVETKFNNIWRFCLDGDGNLYYLTDGNGDEYFQDGVPHVINDPSGQPCEVLAKYSLETAEQLWAVKEWNLPIVFPRALSYTPEGGLFLAGTDRGPGGVFYWIDSENGYVSQETADFLLDVENPPDGILTLYRASFAVDDQYRIYVLDYDIAFDEEPTDTRLCSQKQFVLEPEIVEVAPEDVVTLTITAPYKLDTIDSATRIYQRRHPEVAFVWDTAFRSEEAFNANWMEYKEQFALRAMTGDLGDIVMQSGLGIGLEMVTGTDAFADLSGYMEQSSVKGEVPWSLLETLRGEDGAIRGVPVGIIPTHLIWNEDLLQKYGIDPYTVTWSQLLDLALQWQDDGTNLALAFTKYGGSAYIETTLLRQIVLANLQGSNAAVDTPYLRQLLTNLKALKGSQQLVREGPKNTRKTLFTVTDRTQHNIDKITNLCDIAKADLYTPFAGPFPLGEATEDRQGYAYCWGVCAASQQKDAAWDFLESLISSTGLPLSTYRDHVLSVNTAAQENWIGPWATDFDAWGIGEYYETYFHQLQDTMAVSYARFNEPDGFASVYDSILQYWNDELSLDEALKEAEASWERSLNE